MRRILEIKADGPVSWLHAHYFKDHPKYRRPLTKNPSDILRVYLPDPPDLSPLLEGREP